MMEPTQVDGQQQQQQQQQQQNRLSASVPNNNISLARIYIKVRDFGFPPTDERHLGLGADIPKANRVNRLIRKLGGPDRATARAAAAAALDPSSSAIGNGRSRRTDSIWSLGSVDSSDADDDYDGRRAGRRVTDKGITEEFNNDDFDETLDDREEDGEYEEPQEPLYPGLYRALYAFEPEGMAEMELKENQLVRVVGRGGGVGWAVVVDERGGDEEGGKVQVKHTLVPESYLEAVTLDWMDWEEEEEELEAVTEENENVDGAVVEAEAVIVKNENVDGAVVKAGDA